MEYLIITSTWKPVHRFSYQINTLVYTQKVYFTIVEVGINSNNNKLKKASFHDILHQTTK